METRAHHVLIGLFTVLVVAAALLFGLWLSHAGGDRNVTDYEVVFNDTVNGLSQGSAVQYSGIKIGEVIALGLDPQDPRTVRARIRITGQTPIKQDPRARLAVTNITGASVIQLDGGTPESPKLTSENGEPPIIIADRSPFSRLMAGGEDLMISITRLLDRANQMFSRENSERVSQTLDHLEKITGAVADQRDELAQALQQISQLTREASQVMNTANRLLDGEGREAFASARQLMTSLERSSAQIERLLADNRDAVDGGLQSFAEIGPAITELRDTLGSLRNFSRRLEEDPAGYLLRNDSIKEFQP